MVEAQEARSPKVPLLRVPADDCTLMVGREIEDGKVTIPGTPYYIHKGEWVDVLPVRSMGEFVALTRAARGLDGGTPESMQRLGEAFSSLCEELSRRIVRWNWTDLMGEALPQPYKRPAVIAALSDDEVIWLISAARGEPVEMREKGSTPSPGTSSAPMSRSRRKGSSA